MKKRRNPSIKPQNVLFIYRLTHQGRLFAWIGQALPEPIAARFFRIKSGWSFPFEQRVKTICLPPRPELAGTAFDRMIEYSYKKLLTDFKWLYPIKGIIRKVLLRKAVLLYQLFQQKFRDEAPDLVILWSGLALPLAAAAQAARDCGIPLLFCENGFLPKTIVLDPAGVNAVNALSGKSRDFYDQVQMEPQLLKTLFTEQLIQRPLKKASSRREKLLQEVERKQSLPAEFIFLPLQVHDDSQVLLYSPRFLNMEALVAYCATELKRYNQKNRVKLALVVKEHPSDYGRINYRRLKRAYPELIFLKTIPTSELLRACRVVVTINSTVGIEGLFCFKPVITLGEAFYNLPGLVYHLPKVQELAEAMATVQTNELDRELVQKFLYYLRYQYLVKVDKSRLDQSDPVPIIKIIRKTMA